MEITLPFEKSNSPLLIKGKSHFIPEAKDKNTETQEQLLSIDLGLPNIVPFKFAQKKALVSVLKACGIPNC